MAGKTVEIELSTNVRTGITSVVGAKSFPCPTCHSLNTKFENRHIVCQEQGCGSKAKV